MPDQFATLRIEHKSPNLVLILEVTYDRTMATHRINNSPPTRPSEIEKIDSSLQFSTFTAETAWSLGSSLRQALLEFKDPAIIDISLAQNHHCLFHCATRPGTVPDHASWIVRKRNTVLRFGHSTWYMHNTFGGDQAAFAEKFSLGEQAGEYAIFGGGWPLRVKGVEGIVAVVTVSGLSQEQDHKVITDVIQKTLARMEKLPTTTSA